ncbi:breast cancer anti-estrogen resistance protein 3 homolog isoform X3 [Osmerus eperlanus]
MEDLKKELEEELKLNTEDPRSHAWYHGAVSREGAESLLQRDGDFLVRDSSSSPGDYVLSCCWRNEPMHFKIIRVVLRPKKGYSRELFQFEEDRYDNVPALIRYYVGGRRPISQASGAVIFHPITRTVPLRVISRGAEEVSVPQRSRGTEHTRRLSYNTHTLLPPSTLLRSGSQPANLENLGRRPSLQSAQSDSNLRPGAPPIGQSKDSGPAPISPVFRTGSEPLLSPLPRHTRPSNPEGGVTLRGSDGQLHPRAPPKPLRVSALFPGGPPLQPCKDGDDLASLYDELVIQVPGSGRQGHVERLRAEEKWQSRARLTETSFTFLSGHALSPDTPPEGAGPEEDWTFQRPQTEPVSCFQLDSFESLLLPDQSRPLEPSVLLNLKQLFNQADAHNTALHMLSVDCQVQLHMLSVDCQVQLHMLSVDCQVLRMVGVTEEQKRIMGVWSGLELLLLPHGHQLRQDLLERHHLLALGVAVDILGCTGSVGQRSAVLHKVILLAEALRSHAHDLYAFSAVMKALEMPQVLRLEKTWRTLRRSQTEAAVLFEKKLKPFMKALSQGDDSVVQTPVSVPHLVPLLMLMEGEELAEHSDKGCQLIFDILQSARSIALLAPQYQEHAHTLLTGGWQPIPELLEAFQTEFALRLFWGQGSGASRPERYSKFDNILNVLSNKLEPLEALALTPSPDPSPDP